MTLIQDAAELLRHFGLASGGDLASVSPIDGQLHRYFL